MDEDQWAYYSVMSEEVFATREDVLKWARTVAHENGFVAVIMRSDTYTGSRGRTSFVLIGCERSVHGGEGWAVKLICGIHNHELAKTLVGHPYAGRLTDDEKNIIADMTKLNLKPRNILLTLKEHNSNNSTYKTNRYRLPLLDIVGVTPTGMTFSAGFAYLEGERVNNLVWALERVKSAHWSLKRILQNSVGDLCSVWDAMKNMMMLQHTEIRASFETSTHVVGHVFKKTLYKRLLGMVSRNALNEISVEFERVHQLKDNLSSCGCVLRTTLGLPCACEQQRYEGGSIPLDAVHMYWRRLNFSDQGLCDAEVRIKEEINRIHKRFEELDVCGKVTFKSKLREFAFPDETSMCPPPTKVKTKGAPKKHHLARINKASSFAPPKPARMIPMLDQFPPFMHGFIEDVVDVKADGNCGYRSVSTLLGMGEECWAMMRNELIKELGKWSQDYIKIFGGTERYEQLRLSLHVDGLSNVSMDKWMDITDMGYVIASRYNVILVSLSRQQSFTFFPLRSRPLADSAAHRIICVGLSERSLSLTAYGVVVVKQCVSGGKTMAN
ncbi:uncharacterized protein LOC114404075 [Glycine soja]|uniref:uncharacterized protein LOC114404075 n=1 Tax=Glycine soja TaxID=3848 RepID=UPI00103984C9|nr:uncharacterized protein LOC114404075 [Glycine soja]